MTILYIQLMHNIVATFADDTAILAVGSNNKITNSHQPNTKMDKKMAHPT
jgi:hypothetical protein